MADGRGGQGCASCPCGRSRRRAGRQPEARTRRLAVLARVGWAVRRLPGGPGPKQDLSAFLDRRDPGNLSDEAEPFVDRAGGWLDLMAQAADVHPFTGDAAP